jgi:hypothetical protein
LTSPAFFAIMPEFSAPRFPWARISVRNKSTVASSGSVKQQTSQTKDAGMVWGNPETGVCHKQGTRRYGKAKRGLLESDGIQAGYQPAK